MNVAIKCSESLPCCSVHKTIREIREIRTGQNSIRVLCAFPCSLKKSIRVERVIRVERASVSSPCSVHK